MVNLSYTERAKALDLYFKGSGQLPEETKAFAPETTDLKKLIKSIIKQRQLLFNGGNRKNTAQAQEYISIIGKLLDANKYSKKQLGSFFLRHYDEIHFLATPSRESLLQSIRRYYQSINQ